MTRHERNFSELWMKLPWKKFRKTVFRLQTRLYKAVGAGDKRRINRLQRLLLKSRSARFLAIRQVTQLNIGKKTAGVDGKSKLDHKARFELEELLRIKAHDWKHQGLRRIPIPKKDGTTRWLKVPTVYPYCTSIPESLGIFCLTLAYLLMVKLFLVKAQSERQEKRGCVGSLSVLPVSDYQLSVSLLSLCALN